MSGFLCIIALKGLVVDKLLQLWTIVLRKLEFVGVFLNHKSHILDPFPHPHKQHWTRVSRISQHWLSGMGVAGVAGGELQSSDLV